MVEINGDGMATCFLNHADIRNAVRLGQNLMRGYLPRHLVLTTLKVLLLAARVPVVFKNAICAGSGVLFAGPESALASTIDASVKESIAHDPIALPEVCQRLSTTFQSLTRRLNDLHQDSTTYMKIDFRNLKCSI
ncbi:MAG: hypothetical protein DMG79_16350 [Acidobacteria bacterium]|nr:MAG: hypothetical protein DMG79_16350 [Acidobacteriota bacterium]